MSPELKVIVYDEKKLLKNLLNLLDEQYEAIINKEVIKLDAIAGNLETVSKELATLEIKRRKVMNGGLDIKEVVASCNDENIKQAYEEIKSTLRMLEIQKEANDMLLKQQLIFTKKMINFIKPNNGVKTYNAYGKVGK
ncbi:flagellar protein FlgN [Romboutsia maritimum]|uniref:Flagellar protein FlgN n=1 Tax=Romboutsia maritimum TaxID=2020948 RepID=A0A371IVL5_9FIRM|nr:flagellar protein FlgN [Romboutsia maritimum]RDY24499.1 flagellar protein FlgN [Romboutsia maritimum]